MYVNQKELAHILGITDRRVRQLKEQYGLFTNAETVESKKKYKLEDCVPEYIAYKLESEGQSEGSIDRTKEQAEHERVKKKISELKLKKLRNELHYAEDVQEFLTDMLSNFKNSMLVLAQRCAPLVVGEDDTKKVLGIIEKEVYSTLEQLSEYDPEAIERGHINDDEDEDEDD